MIHLELSSTSELSWMFPLHKFAQGLAKSRLQALPGCSLPFGTLPEPSHLQEASLIQFEQVFPKGLCGTIGRGWSLFKEVKVINNVPLKVTLGPRPLLSLLAPVYHEAGSQFCSNTMMYCFSTSSKGTGQPLLDCEPPSQSKHCLCTRH